MLTRCKVYLYIVNNTNTMHIDSLNGLYVVLKLYIHIVYKNRIAARGSLHKYAQL